MMRWKYLFFDLDGTLTDPMVGITSAVQYALRHFDIEVNDLRTLCPFIGPPLKDSFREFYNLSDADAQIALDKYREYFAPKGIFENTLYDGIPQLLADMQQRGAVMAIATSKPTLFAEQIARHFGIADHFTLISGSMLDGSRDAKVDVIRHALDQLRITDPSQVVMIGDRRFDIEGARQTGIDSIGVLYGYGSREEIDAARPGAIATDVARLHELLLQ